jgi:O-succinylhomoserine sulfhydrylase
VFVDGEDLSQWEEALSVPTQAVFFETPSNPMQSLVDIAAVCDLAHAAGAKVVLDNVFATPLLQQGLPLGADVVVYSGTKHIDGQGRVLGGAILGDKEYIDGPVQKLMRHTGPAISAFNAWTMLKGLETLAVRVNYSNAAAQRIAEFLENHPSVSWVKYPFLESHPQYDLAKRQMRGGGTVVTFELAGGTKESAFEVLDKLRVIDISNNLGDAKSLITHPATTTHRAMGPEGRAAIGLGDAVVRVSIGLEGTEDLIADLELDVAVECGQEGASQEAGGRPQRELAVRRATRRDQGRRTHRERNHSARLGIRSRILDRRVRHVVLPAIGGRGVRRDR